MTQYNRGANFERAVKLDMERLGYVCIRSAASHGKADLVCCKAGQQTVFIQCKYSGGLGWQEWNEFFDTCEKGGCVPIMADHPKRGVTAYHRLLRKKLKGEVKPMVDWNPERGEDESYEE